MKLPRLPNLLKKILLNHKKGYSQTGNTDSIIQRSQAAKAGSMGDGEVSQTQRGGKEIEKMLDIENPPQRGISDSTPLKMMDIVKQVWSKDYYYDKEKVDREEDEDER